MQTTFLKAGSGDSILIRHKTYNILIDGGNDSKYLLDQVGDIHKSGQCLDLIIITHHDDDHIAGIIELLKKVVNGDYGDRTKFIKQVIFNSPRVSNAHFQKGEKTLSYKQANEVEVLLLAINQTSKLFTDESDPIEFEDLKISFLSPSLTDVKEYGENKGAYLSSDHKCDWNSKLEVLSSYIDDKSQDTSLYNRNSIVLIVECENQKILLTGDVTPGRLEVVLAKLKVQNGNSPVKFDYIKLPHHGSYRSITQAIVQNVSCDRYIISTNSKKYFLPNKRTIAKILKYANHRSKITFLFNYHEALNSMNLTSDEMRDFKFELISNNQDYGLTI